MITKKAMTGNARHGEHQTPPSVSYLWAGAKKSATINDSGSGAGARPCWRRWRGLNIPLHTTFYCFIKLPVNHAFTSFKPFHLFRISQAYIYNSALSCIIRVRKISRLRSLRDGCFNCCRSMLSAHTLSILFFYPIVINPDTERLHAILFSIESASIFRRNIRRENVHRHSPFAKKVYKTPCKLERTMI